MGAPFLGLAKSIYDNENNRCLCIVYERQWPSPNLIFNPKNKNEVDGGFRPRKYLRQLFFLKLKQVGPLKSVSSCKTNR